MGGGPGRVRLEPAHQSLSALLWGAGKHERDRHINEAEVSAVPGCEEIDRQRREPRGAPDEEAKRKAPPSLGDVAETSTSGQRGIHATVPRMSRLSVYRCRNVSSSHYPTLEPGKLICENANHFAQALTAWTDAGELIEHFAGSFEFAEAAYRAAINDRRHDLEDLASASCCRRRWACEFVGAIVSITALSRDVAPADIAMQSARLLSNAPFTCPRTAAERLGSV
jgi:hypothetical protein